MEINWLSIFLATFVGMICAGLWYTKRLFGPLWRQLTGISEADSKKAGNTPMVIVLFSNLITAIVLFAVIDISRKVFNDASLALALLVGFLLWAAFSATTLLTHNSFEQKRPKLTWINIGYQLVLFMSMALVIGLF